MDIVYAKTTSLGAHDILKYIMYKANRKVIAYSMILIILEHLHVNVLCNLRHLKEIMISMFSPCYSFSSNIRYAPARMALSYHDVVVKSIEKYEYPARF